MTQSSNGSPLSSRPRDWFFVLAFSFFAFSSFFSDAWHALGLLEGDAFWARANRWYIEVAGDSYLAAGHAYSRVNSGISGLVFGPFYLVLVYALIKGKSWIRVPALLYVGAMLHGAIEFFVWEYWIGPRPGNPLVFWAFNGPYVLIPFLLGVRMWRSNPFGAGDG